MSNTGSRDTKIWSWLPTLYFAEALPYVTVNTLTVLLYTKLNVDLATMTFYTGWLYLPWVIKPFWSPFVDIFSSKRKWVLAMQMLMGLSFASIALAIPTSLFFSVTLAFFWLAAFFSATHDIAADGYYMLRLTDHEQAAFVGVRSTFYRFGSLFASGALVWIAGCIEEAGLPDGATPSRSDIVYAWSAVFWIVGVMMLAMAVYHSRFMPKAHLDVPRKEKNIADIFSNFALTFATFFKKKGVLGAIGFMLLYRLPEALCIKLVAPFLLSDRAEGGLGMSTKEVGIANGVTGVVAILIGGIIGGIAISRGGLKRWLWPMALSLTLPCMLYCALAMLQPETNILGLVCVNMAIFAEQFGYGFGFTAFMLYLIYFSEGKWKTSHYAFCTAFMALGMMIPGMFAGDLHALLSDYSLFASDRPQGYVNFFWLVVLCSVFTCIACTFVRIDPHFGKKSEKGNNA